MHINSFNTWIQLNYCLKTLMMMKNCAEEPIVQKRWMATTAGGICVSFNKRATWGLN